MRKTKLFSLAMLAVAWLTGGSAQAWDEPTQDADGVWQLGSVNDVEWFADYIEAGNTTANAVLTADIDYEGQTHTPIGQNQDRKFNGVFDGQFHHIKNLHMTGTNTGFFGFVRGGTTIQNLIIDATCSFEATERCGSLIGFIQAKAGGAISINNVVNFGSVTSGSKVAGGILAAGHTNNDHPVVNMANCVNAGTITCPSIDGANPADKAAALIGWNKSASISTLKACYNIGECTPLDGVNNLFRGTNRAMPNSYDLVNTTAQGKSGTQGLKTDWVTADPLHSGELCYVLNNGDMSANGIKYKQDLSDPTSIPMPVPDGPLVYEVADYYCDGTPKGSVAYSNTEGGSTQDNHDYDSVTGLCTFCSTPQVDWMSADADGWYLLGTPAEVEWFSNMVKIGYGAMNAKLTADIDYEGVADAHLPIGTSAKKYFGHFDGQGHRIKGMVLTTAANLSNPGYDGLGFFGSVRGGGTDADGTVTNEVIIENLIIDASCSVNHDQNFAAGVVAHINSRNDNDSHIIIRYCGNEANVSSTGKNVAGILGCVEGTEVGLTIMQCYNTGNIYGGAGESAAICGWTGTPKDYLVKVASGCWNIGEVTGIDGNGYNLFRTGKLNNELYPAIVNCVDLCTTNGGNQGKVTINTEDPITSGELCYLLNGDQSTITWTQTLGEEEIPNMWGTTSQVFQAGTVDCTGASVGTINYNNVSGETVTLPHQISDEMGMCSVCHTQFQEPALVDGWYELKNAGNVEWFSQYVSTAGGNHSNAKMMNDIDFYSITNLHSPIGPNEQNKFNATFDGQGYRIKNMIIERPTESNIGFFGWLRGNNAPTTVKNLIIDESCSIHAYNRVGGVTGTYQNGGSIITIENVINEATVTAEHQDAGGIFGGHQAGNPTIIIRNVLNTGAITALNEHPYAGALCCYLGVDTGTSLIENFVNLGTVVGHEGGNIGRHNISNVTNLIDLSATTDKTQGEVEGLSTNDIAGGKLAYLLNGNSCYDVNWTQTIGTDDYPVPFNNKGKGIVNHISAAGYTTQYIPSTDVTIPADVEAYAGVINGSSLSLVAIEDAISMEDAVVLKGDEGYYSFVPTTGVSKAANNDLKGSDGNVDGGSNIYALSKQNDMVGFYPVSSEIKIPAGKAYLDTTAEGVKGFTFVFDDATGLNNIDANVNLNEVIYNVAGQRISKMQKGINIVNGKKILK